MATRQINRVVEEIRKVVLASDAAEVSDGQLLEHFIAQREEAAFDSLLRRHGPMVLSVCQRVLGNHHDAEDAFQATFLVLARKASSIVPRQMVGNWLYGVAYHTALKARTVSAKRQVREKQMNPMPEREAPAHDSWPDLQRVLDQELSGLSDKYRVPIVLCDLEGKSQKEAAQHLGLPEGTFSSRLSRGRAMLAKRLARQGLTFSAGALAAALAQHGASACVPAVLASSTIKAAGAFAAGQSATGLVSGSVATLTDGVLKAMLLTKLRMMAAVLVLVCGIGFTAFALSPSDAGTQPPAEKKALPQDPVRQEGPGPGADVDAKPGADTGKAIRSLPGHKDRLTSVAYSPDGTSIATAAWDGTIRLWDPKSGKEVRRLDVPPTESYNPAYLSQVLFSPDNQFIVAAQQSMPNEPGVIVWNRRTGERVRDFPGECIAFSPDGKHIACGGSAIPKLGNIRLYELATGKVVRGMHSQQDRIRSLTFSPDGKTLVSTGALPRPLSLDGSERLGFMPAVNRVWDVTTGKELPSTLKRLEFGGGLSKCLALSPDGRTLAVADSLWEIATGGHRAGLTGHSHGVCAVAFAPDGRTLASASMDGTVRLWDLRSGKEIGRFGKEVGSANENYKKEGRWVLAVAFSPDGRTLVSGGLDVAKGGAIPSTANIWDVSRITGRPRTSAERSPADLEADWKDLAGDAAAGYAALGRLVSSPERGVPFLAKQLQSAQPVDTKRIERLIADLNNGHFQIREKAAKELETLTDRAVPTLRKALAGNPSLEAKRRLEALLDRLEAVGTSAETIREVRVVEALEWIGNAEARRLLAKLAAGAPETRLTQEAKEATRALSRIEKH
jgi:RNA polymerase sigma factor (sigma-70 family)